MIITLYIILLLLCSFLFYEDWKYRGVSWPIFLAIMIISLLLQLESLNSWFNVLMNVVFIVLVLLSLTLYLTIRTKQLVNIFESSFGIGDALFLLAISPLFVNQNFILFFITGMFLSGVLHLIVNIFKQNPKIPLAGYLAIYLNLWLVVGLLIDKNLLIGSLI